MKMIANERFSDIRFVCDRWLRKLASLWLTLLGLVLLAAAILAASRDIMSPTWALALPLVLLVVNMSAAIISHPKFKQQTPLLAFHLGLLLVILLIVLGRMTYLNGWVEVTAGGTFHGRLAEWESGPWHAGNIESVRFINRGFSINYGDTGRRKGTYNRVIWRDHGGVEQSAVIGDDHPLMLGGYRFYTTSTKGFAPRFSWFPADRSMPQEGIVHMKPYPAFELEQAKSWQLPGTDLNLWIMLDFDETIIDLTKPSTFRAPEDHRLIVRYDNDDSARRVMVPGDSIELTQGRLTYIGLTTWMGYRVVYDWTLTWLAATGFLTTLCLLWFYWQKCGTESWLSSKDKHLKNINNENIRS